MLGGMDHDSASLLPDAEGSAVFASEHGPRQPNSRDAADTLTQFAFRLQGSHTLSTCSSPSTTLRSLFVTTAACALTPAHCAWVSVSVSVSVSVCCAGETKGRSSSKGSGASGARGGYAGAQERSGGGRRGQQQQHAAADQHGEPTNTPFGHAQAVGSAIAAKSLSPRKRRRLGMDGDSGGSAADPGLMVPQSPWPCPPPARPVAASGGGCDAHFIVHLFVTAIADGKMAQDSMVPKTWDVLQQVITKVSKEQNTSITLHGTSMEIKMRVFVCNSVEARAVGEYITAHKDQRPAPFVVLARQLSMAIAYDSAQLDPSQAAVADRLRKQAKTRAVKEIREAMRDAPSDVSGPVLRGYVGALAPAAHIEALLLRRTVKVDLEGDEERAYIFFDAKNRSIGKETGVEVTLSSNPSP